MKTKVEEYLKSRLPGHLFIVDIQLNESKKHLSVFLDGDAGISVETCGEISKELEQLLEEGTDNSHNYTLNVSSAGIGTPLTNRRQFRKNVNQSIAVSTDENHFKGRLVLVGNDHLAIKDTKKEAVAIKMKDIREAIVEI
jgi:ribosome maturation factor RimP